MAAAVEAYYFLNNFMMQKQDFKKKTYFNKFFKFRVVTGCRFNHGTFFIFT